MKRVAWLLAAGVVAGFFAALPPVVVQLAQHRELAAGEGGTTLLNFASVGGAFLFIGAVHFRLRRFVVLAAISLGLGYALFFLRLGNALGPMTYLCLFGVALVVSGGLALRAFVRQNPIAETKTENQP